MDKEKKAEAIAAMADSLADFPGHLENRTGHRKKTMRAAISHVISTRKGPLATLRTTLVRNLTRRSAH